jgi:NAD(P)-dependent dehydrogenase (short-subunit alcohol dehydrogenase family)
MEPLVWLVTGCTSGVGAAIVREIASRGDKVIATGRNAEERIASIGTESISVLDLDLESGKLAIDAQVKKAIAIWGRVDVLLNNAGMSDARCLEEADDAFIAKQFNVNLFGTMHVTQAVLPYMRAQVSGHIAFVGTAMAWGRVPFLGIYGMTKAALTNFAEALDIEVRQFGVKTTIFELGQFATKLGMPRTDEVNGFMSKPGISAYHELHDKAVGAMLDETEGSGPGDMATLVTKLVDCVKGEGIAAGRKVPIRVLFGIDSWAIIKQKCEEQLQICDEWREISISVNGPGSRPSQMPVKSSSIKPENYPF